MIASESKGSSIPARSVRRASCSPRSKVRLGRPAALSRETDRPAHQRRRHGVPGGRAEIAGDEEPLEESLIGDHHEESVILDHGEAEPDDETEVETVVLVREIMAEEREECGG